MKKYIKSSYEDSDLKRSVHRAVAEMINHPIGSKLYDQIKSAEDKESFVEGILACADAAGIRIKGLGDLYGLMVEEGVETVLDAIYNK